MATPNIGTTISEGYSRGLDRIGPLVSSALVPAVAIGGIALVLSALQQPFLADGGDGALSVFGTPTAPDNKGDAAIVGILAALQSVVIAILGGALVAMLAGALHRERHTGTLETPSMGASLGATMAMIPLLMPKLALLALLGVVGTLVGIVSTALGGLVGFAAIFVSIWLSIRWVYASVIAGSGEATGDAAYERSDQVVSGSWWGTFGEMIVVGLAIGLPVLIVGMIIGAVLGAINVLLGVVGLMVTLFLLGSVIWPAALDSAWTQVEGASDGSGLAHDQTAFPTPHQPPTPSDGDQPHSGPFV